MSVELILSIFAAFFAVISFLVNWHAANAAERHGRMPVLVSQIEKGTLIIRNVGNGPALNIVLADAPGYLATTDLRKLRVGYHALDGLWKNFRHLRPIQPHTEHRYLGAPTGALGVTYTDALGATYTLLASKYGTKIIGRTAMPYEPFVDKAKGTEMPYLFEQ